MTTGIDLQLNLGGGYTDGTGEDAIYIEKGDFLIKNGKFLLVPEDDIPKQVGQRLHVRLMLRRGEVFFNSNAGFPYVDISEFKNSKNIFDTNMKSYILATDGVNKLQSYQSQIARESRVNEVRFAVTVKDDTTVSITQELDV